MKKTFKQSFGVTGTPAQLQAFKEWAESVGWVYHEIREGEVTKLFFDSRDGKYNKCMALHTNTYHLPSQWAEAMEAAIDTEIVWEKGDWVITKSYTETYDGKPLKITNIYDGEYCNFEQARVPDHNFSLCQILRPATPDEIEAARPKTEFIRGQKYINPKNGCVIYCTSPNGDACDRFSGVIVDNEHEYQKGTHGTHWLKSAFTLHTSPVTL